MTQIEEVKRPRGRPRIGGGDDGILTTRKNLSMDQASLEIADRIHGNTSVAVRIALAYWDEHNPPAKPAKK